MGRDISELLQYDNTQYCASVMPEGQAVTGQAGAGQADVSAYLLIRLNYDT